MNFYDKIKQAEVSIPRTFNLTSSQMLDLESNAPDMFYMIFTAFKFGYMQGRRFEQASRTNKPAEESEQERLRRYICEMAGHIRSERRLRRIYTVAHRAFINDGLEALNERQD